MIESTENIYKYHMQLNLGEKVKGGKVANGTPRERIPSIADQHDLPDPAAPAESDPPSDEPEQPAAQPNRPVQPTKADSSPEQ